MITLTLIILLTIWLLRRDALKKIDNHHIGRYVSLSDAKRVGLLLNASDPGAYDCLDIFRTEMERRKIDYSIAYLDRRRRTEQAVEFPESEKITRLGWRQLKWYGAPKPETADSFAGKDMDILIDFTFFNRYYPLQYLFRYTDSTLKLGIVPNRTKEYDLIIQSGKTPEETTPEVQTQLMKHILNYLYNIK